MELLAQARNSSATCSCKKKRIDQHFAVLNLISYVFCLAFILSVILSKSIPNYFVGFIGTILGYYFAKRPWEIK